MKTKQKFRLVTVLVLTFGGLLIFNNITLRGKLKQAEKENEKLGYKINNLIYQLGKTKQNKL